VLKAVFDIFNLAFLGHSSELPAEFSALSESSSTEGMSLGDEATTRVNNNTSSVSEFVVIDGRSGSTGRAETESLVSAELVSRETVM
jgi:hypothetical protein